MEKKKEQKIVSVSKIIFKHINFLWWLASGNTFEACDQ